MLLKLLLLNACYKTKTDSAAASRPMEPPPRPVVLVAADAAQRRRISVSSSESIAEPESPSAKRAAQEILAELPVKKKTLRLVVEPSPSLNDLIRRNPRDRLFVQPLHWTAQHLDLLDCEFEREYHAHSLRGSGISAYGGPEEGRAHAIEDVSDFLKPACNSALRATVISDMLFTHGFYSTCVPDRLELFFGKTSVGAGLRVDGLFASAPDRPAALAYLDLCAVPQRRGKTLGMPRCKQENLPVARIRKKRQAMLQPPKKLHDPYIATVLIGLAQAQRIEGVTPDSYDEFAASNLTDADSFTARLRDMSGFKVCILAASATSLFIYSACIPPAFLDRFDHPSEPSLAGPLKLYYNRLPLHMAMEVSRRLEGMAQLLGGEQGYFG